MFKAYLKDILRTIKNNGKRFIALMIITTLGLTAFAGIYAACRDYYISADRFFDEQQLFDIRVLSTLGLTEDDVEALQSLDSVEKADGSFRKMAHTMINDVEQSAEVVMISPQGINAPYVLEGVIPHAAGEIAVNQKYLNDSGKKIGDTLTMREILDNDDEGEDSDVANPSDGDNVSDTDDNSSDSGFDTDFNTAVDTDTDTEPAFKRETFTITASVTDPMYVANAEGTAGFRFITSSLYTFFILPIDIDTDIYTSIFITLKDVAHLECYSTEYKEHVAVAIDGINNHIKSQREQARYSDIVSEATDKISDVEVEINDKFTEIDTEIADAWQELEDARAELTDGIVTLTNEEQDALQQIENAKGELENAKRMLEESQNALNDSIDELKDNIIKAHEGQEELDRREAEALAGFAMTQTQLSDAQEQLDALAALGTDVSTEQAALDEQVVAFERQKVISEKQLADAQAELYESSRQIEAATDKIDEGQQQIDEGWLQHRDGIWRLKESAEKAQKEIADAWQEIEDGEKELAEGQVELVENEREYQERRADATQQIADAYAELDDIDMARWYIQDRTSIDSYVGLDTDLISINVIGRAFPVLFLIVAILISLTTMTRMVEEERGLIGTYKALGYSNLAIALKYLIYALAASVMGSLLGYITGFIVLPRLLFVVLNVIYVIPNTKLYFDFAYGSIGALMFIISILIATAIVCRKEVRRVPASLMRPKTPKMGARILLERFSFIWSRLSFINKITARNIFRYKKRLTMTVFGIACCTALVLMGFAIRDSVIDLMPKQYDDIDQYDLMAFAESGDEDKLFKRLTDDEEVSGFLAYQAYNVKLTNSADKSENIYLNVIPNGGELENYMNLTDLDGNPITFSDKGVYVTQNTAELLELSAGDNVVLQDLLLDQYETNIQGVIRNYLGNNLYITETLYEALIDKFEPNGIYAHINGDAATQKAYAKELSDEDYITVAYSTEENKEQFSTDFAVINFVIYILIILAACLAFVVLFTLASTNVSERMRELATIKVLGFYDREVYSYVNKETLLLTGISVLAGMPLGYLLSGLLLYSLKMPSIQFVLIIRPQSYLFAGLISFSFTLIVNLITNRMLNKINMVEALKSVE